MWFKLILKRSIITLHLGKRLHCVAVAIKLKSCFLKCKYHWMNSFLYLCKRFWCWQSFQWMRWSPTIHMILGWTQIEIRYGQGYSLFHFQSLEHQAYDCLAPFSLSGCKIQYWPWSSDDNMDIYRNRKIAVNWC